MDRQEKAEKVGEQLDELYGEPEIPLDHGSAYELLVAALLSARSTDEQVNEVTPKLFEMADTPAAMAECSVEAIEERIESVGLAPTKAERIRKLSSELVERHDGEVPSDLDELEELTGVGHKTAQVVKAQWFDEPAFPVDTHIQRLANRWGLSDGDSPTAVEEDLKALFDEEEWIRRHLQMIYFGREYCPAKGHEPAECPICEWAQQE